MASAVDEQLKQAFASMQVKMQETRKQLTLGDAAVEQHKAAIQRAELTKKELNSLGDGTCTYQTVGRMFLKQSVTASIADLEADIAEAEEKIEKVNKQKEYLERTLKESQDNLREMVQARKNKS